MLGKGFRGAVDYLYLYDRESAEPAITYTGSETPDDGLRGDVNADGKFDAADVVLLQQWLLAVPDTKLKNWQAGDLNEDGILDVFDLGLMKRL